MSKAHNTNYHLTTQRIFFRVSQHDALYREIFGSEPPAKLHEFTRAFLTPGTREYRELQSATSDADRKCLAALVLLSRALSIAPGQRTARDLYDATRLLIPEYSGPRSTFSGADPKQNAWLYAGLLNIEIRKAHLAVISTSRGQLPTPSLVCPDIRTAAFVWAAYRGLEVCPACGKMFAPNPERPQKYCSINCGQRIYQRRHRRRQKSKKLKSKKKG